MKERIIKFLIPIVSVLAVTLSCAKVVAPTGGPKDTKPPVVIKSVPLNGSANFKGKNIVITFDEYVVLDKMNEKFMISPPMNKNPRILLKGKSVFIEFLEKLRDNTTYTLYFQDAIRDLNENNPINNFQYVFSTGRVVDSLTVTGNVFYSYNLEPPTSSLIMLYKQLADSAPEKMIPDYISQSDINGGFKLHNIMEGSYRLYALVDKNDNKKYDLGEEAFAFMNKAIDINAAKNYFPVIKDTVKIKDTIKVNDTEAFIKSLLKTRTVPLIDGEYKLFLFTTQRKAYFLASSARDLPYKLVYTLSKPPDTSRFEVSLPGINKNSYFIERSIYGDTIRIWLTDSTVYSRQQINTVVRFPFTDSTGATRYKRDTVTMRFQAIRTPKTKAVKPSYKFSTNIGYSMLRPGQQIILSSPTPFRSPDTSRIRLYETTTTGKITSKIAIPYLFIRDSTNSCRYTIKAKLKEGSGYLLIADSRSIGNIYGAFADSAGMKFTVQTPDDFGKLILPVINGEGNLIVQLLDGKENLVAEKLLKNEGKAEFSFLDRGTYRVRVIYDLNGDGKWTTGDFNLNLQPEPVSYYPEELEIKFKGEVEQDPWDVSKKNMKEQKLRDKKAGK
jgi:hypothetical protein